MGWSGDCRKGGEGVMPPVASSLGGGELGTMSLSEARGFGAGKAARRRSRLQMWSQGCEEGTVKRQTWQALLGASGQRVCTGEGPGREPPMS